LVVYRSVEFTADRLLADDLPSESHIFESGFPRAAALAPFRTKPLNSANLAAIQRFLF